MLKQTFTYTDFDDKTVEETLHFNLTKTELTENLHLRDELESLKELSEGDKRDLSPEEIRQIVELVKTFMRLSYGVRSEDGKRFVKTPELWTEFTQTAAYDGFLFSLFENPERAVAFMAGILPGDLRAQVAKSADQRQMLAKLHEVAKEAQAEEPSKPLTIIDGELPDDSVPRLTPEQLAAAAKDYVAKNNLT